MNEWLLNHLVCPRDHGALTLESGSLICQAGHRYPIVQDVPVMLLSEVEQTFGAAQKSLERASDPEKSKDDPFFTDTLGLSEEQRSAVKKRMNQLEQEPIDPVANAMVAATSGYLYEEVCGNLREYPIPNLRLPDGNGTFVDVGCNWGRWSIAAARKGYKVVGIDPQLGAVLAAQRVSRKLGLTPSFVVADARFLPFANASFDIGFSFGVFQHLSKPNAVAAIREIARVVKPSGCSLVQMANAFGIRSLYHQLKRGFREPRDFDVRYWTPKELLKTFTDIIGQSELFVDGYFGLGIQAEDAKLLPLKHRVVIRSSEALRKVTNFIPYMMKVADSLYIKSVRKNDP
jgi:SAM-dependent methyltransferase/uncharacterized protein YbaR (Trm112 family)